MKSPRLIASILFCLVSGSLSAATFTVTTTTNSGAGSLRQAITDANASAEADIIEFNISGAGVHSLQPDSALPEITGPLVIDGYTQPGAIANSNPVNQALNTAPLIELRGPGATAGDRIGLLISAGESTVRGLAITGFGGAGIRLQTNGGNTIAGNFIGVSAGGIVARGNGIAGVDILSSNANVIGGTEPAARNLISGNTGDGVHIGELRASDSDAMGNLMQGNLIGTDITGATALGNQGNGVNLEEGANNNTLGGAAAGTRNLISGNTLSGILIRDDGTDANLVLGNLIGTDVTGAAALGNRNSGVLIDNEASVNRVGGATGEANVIAFNGTTTSNGAGVRVVSGTRNTVSGNSIFSNTGAANNGLGIDLGSVGITANDDDDADIDTGANDLQNFPVLDSVITADGETTVDGIFNSRPDTLYTLEFFSSPLADSSGNGEGRDFVASLAVTTNGSGVFSLSEQVLGVIVAEGLFLTATATDPEGNTSEFSMARQVTGRDPNPGMLQFSEPAFRFDEGVGDAVITVTRNGGSGGAVTVRFETRNIDGSAVSDEDYRFTEGTITFADGDAAPKTFNIPIINDSTAESSETLTVLLSNPGNGATLGTPNSIMLTIVDDDTTSSPGDDDTDDDGDGECCNYTFFGSCSLCIACRPGAPGDMDPVLPVLVLISVVYLVGRQVRRRSERK